MAQSSATLPTPRAATTPKASRSNTKLIFWIILGLAALSVIPDIAFNWRELTHPRA
jgi:hypothetical protein